MKSDDSWGTPQTQSGIHEKPLPKQLKIHDGHFKVWLLVGLGCIQGISCTNTYSYILGKICWTTRCGQSSPAETCHCNGEPVPEMIWPIMLFRKCILRFFWVPLGEINMAGWNSSNVQYDMTIHLIMFIDFPAILLNVAVLLADLVVAGSKWEQIAQLTVDVLHNFFDMCRWTPADTFTRNPYKSSVSPMSEHKCSPEVQLGNMINLNQKLVGSPVKVLFYMTRLAVWWVKWEAVESLSFCWFHWFDKPIKRNKQVLH